MIVRSYYDISYITLANRRNRVCFTAKNLHTTRLLYRRRKRSLRMPDSNERNTDYNYHSKYDESFFTRVTRISGKRREEGVRAIVQYVVWYESLMKRSKAAKEKLFRARIKD